MSIIDQQKSRSLIFEFYKNDNDMSKTVFRCGWRLPAGANNDSEVAFSEIVGSATR
jgi:hypothetical protein